MSPTIYDIARVANVSKSTVSRVLNNQTNISDAARERVLKAIEELLISRIKWRARSPPPGLMRLW